MTSTNHLEHRVDDLEQTHNCTIPDQLRVWGIRAGLSDAEIREKWNTVVNRAGDNDPMTVVWEPSLEGELFDDEEGNP